MLIRFCSFILLILVFVGLNSCKKENTNPPQPPQANLNDSCNTVEDCKAIGKYYVAAYYYYFDPPSGSTTELLYGHTTIIINEISPGKIAFHGDSIFHIKLNAAYDSLLQFYYPYYGPSGTHPNFVWSGNSDTSAQIAFYGGDTIYAIYTYPTPVDDGHAGYEWFGVKIH